MDIAKPRRLALAFAVAFPLAALPAMADRIDLNAELVKRLAKAGKLTALYKAKTGRDLPASLGVTAIFQGQVGGRGLVISAPGVIPTSPLVMQQDEVVNCNSEPTLQSLQIDSSVTNSTNFQNTDQLQTSQEYTVTVGYSSPWGASASASTTQGRTQVAMHSTGGGDSTTTSWKYAPQITVGASKAVTTQFVVTQQKLDNIPYTANFVLAGPVQLVFSAGAEGYQWVERRGAALPSSPSPLKLGNEGNTPNYVCRVKTDNGYILGKTQGGTCYFGQNGQRIFNNMYPGSTTETFEYLVGRQEAIALGEPLAGNTFDADGKGLQLCVQQWRGTTLPGYVAKDGTCLSELDHFSVIQRAYKVVLDPRVGGVQVDVPDISKVLSEADTTFNLRGLFSGVYAVKGNLRIGSAMPATDCELVAPAAMASRATSASFSTSALAGKPKAPARAMVKRVKAGALLPESQALEVPPSH
jgi:hypothetical protein